MQEGACTNLYLLVPFCQSLKNKTRTADFFQVALDSI